MSDIGELYGATKTLRSGDFFAAATPTHPPQYEPVFDVGSERLAFLAMKEICD